MPRPDGRPLLRTAFDDADTEILSRFVLRVKSDDEGAVPSDWQAKIDAADASFVSDDDGMLWRSQPGLANGMIGTAMSSSDLFLSGVYSNRSRVSITTELPGVRLRSAGLKMQGALLDLREATYTRRYTFADGECRAAVEQRWYASRAAPSLFVMEVAVRVPCGCAWHRNISLPLSINATSHVRASDGMGTANMTSHKTSDGARVSVGSASQPEGANAPVLITVVSTALPQTIEVPTTVGCAANFSRRFVLVVRSSKSRPGGSGSVLDAATSDYKAAMRAGADELHDAHKAAWAELWRSGIEIGGRREAALVTNTSLCGSLELKIDCDKGLSELSRVCSYWVLSSLRSDWPYSCCGSGLYNNGWNGVAF